jgi:hypothetical protein
MQPPVISLDQRFTLCEDKRYFETIRPNVIVREKTAPRDAKFGAIVQFSPGHKTFPAFLRFHSVLHLMCSVQFHETSDNELSGSIRTQKLCGRQISQELCAIVDIGHC